MLYEVITIRCRHSAVLEHQGRGVRRADAELVLGADQGHAGCSRRHHEGLDRRTAGALVQGRPDDDMSSPFCTIDEAIAELRQGNFIVLVDDARRASAARR